MKSRKLKRVFALLMTTLLCLTVFTVPSTADSAAPADKNEITITLLATSDIHGRYMAWDYAMDDENKSGSMVQLSAIVKQVREDNPNTILMDAGDLIQDNSSELFQKMSPHPAMLALNYMGYDAWTLGNHEYDYTLNILDSITKQFKGAVLAGNMYSKDGQQNYKSYTIVEKGGVKVGIVGMTTPMVAEFKEGTDIFNNTVFKNPSEETKKAIEELKGKVDVIVGLYHMGLENENNHPDTGVRDIATKNPELAAIFAGHMHQLIKSETVNGVLIVEPDKYATNISRVDLTFEKKDGKYVLKDKKAAAMPVKDKDGKTVVPDTELERILEPFHKVARDDANTVVGELKGMDFVAPNEIKGIPTVQIQETPLTNFFSEVMLYYSKADVVAHQIDTDLAKLNIGQIKKKDIAFNYRYAGGEVTVYKVTGKDLKDYMEWSAGYFNSTKPGDVTVSFDPVRRASKYSTNDIFGGVKYDIDLSKPYGERIVNLTKLDGTPIKPNDEIKLGLNAYRMKALIGKGGALEGRKFAQLSSTQDESAFGEVEGRIRNLAARYIKEVKKGVVIGTMNNTWKIVGVETKLPERADVVALVNKGILEVPKTDDGKYTNIASINVKAAVTPEIIAKLTEKAGIDAAKLGTVTTTGELYHAINQLLKATDPVKVEEKPDTAPNKNVVYTVKSGDTLAKIASRYKVDWKELAKLNHLKNPNLIYPGQTIIIW